MRERRAKLAFGRLALRIRPNIHAARRACECLPHAIAQNRPRSRKSTRAAPQGRGPMQNCRRCSRTNSLSSGSRLAFEQATSRARGNGCRNTTPLGVGKSSRGGSEIKAKSWYMSDAIARSNHSCGAALRGRIAAIRSVSKSIVGILAVLARFRRWTYLLLHCNFQCLHIDISRHLTRNRAALVEFNARLALKRTAIGACNGFINRRAIIGPAHGSSKKRSRPERQTPTRVVGVCVM